jgi:hypothetical protein
MTEPRADVYQANPVLQPKPKRHDAMKKACAYPIYARI